MTDDLESFSTAHDECAKRMIFFHFIADIPHGPFPYHGTIGQLENESLSHSTRIVS